MAESVKVNMQHFSQFPAQKNLTLLTLLALSLTVGLMFYLQVIDQQLAPYGIVAVEFAWTPVHAQQMIATWDEAGNEAARLSLWVDFVFMPAYAFLFAGLTLIAARAAHGRWQTFGLRLTLAPFAAWLFDITENAALLYTLNTANDLPGLPLIIAGVSATLKFSLLVICLLYMVLVFIRRWIGKSA